MAQLILPLEPRRSAVGENPVDPALVDALVLGLTPERKLIYAKCLAEGACLHENTPERFIDGRPETYWGVCLTTGVVADMGHHVAKGGSTE